jgi:hypothetical protein
MTIEVGGSGITAVRLLENWAIDAKILTGNTMFSRKKFAE